jgi:prefoldin subunit 5
MAPLEAQIRQHREQLRHRQTSIQRIHDATESLEQKIGAFDAAQRDLEQVKARLGLLAGAVTRVLDASLDTAPSPAPAKTLEVA